MKTMKKIVLTFIAAMLCVMATAQVPQQVDGVRAELDKYRRIIKEKVYSLVAAANDDSRDDIIDEIEDLFEDLEDYVKDGVSKLAPSSSVSKSVIVDDFYCAKTPTTLDIKYGDFSFYSRPVTYEYHDGDIEVYTRPTNKRVSTPSFYYESLPSRSTFKIFGNGDNGDTVSVREGKNVRFSVTTNKDDVEIHYDTTSGDYVYVKNRRNGFVMFRSKDSAYIHNKYLNRDNNRRRVRDFSVNADGLSYFYVGVNNFLNDEDVIDEPQVQFMELNSGRSIEIGFYTSLYRWRFTKFMAMDLGFDYRLRHYSFQHSFSLVKDNGVISADYTLPDGVKEFKKHNLRLQYISIPLTMEWRLGDRDNPFILSAGLEGSIRLGCREKQVYKLDDERKVERKRNDFETRFLTYATTFGLGYKRFEVYTNYSPSGFFKENHGPELYPLSIGVRFLMDK